MGGRRAGPTPLPPELQPTARDREDGLYKRAAMLGLCGPLGKRRADEWAGEVETDGRGRGAPLVDELRATTRRRLMRGSDLGRLSTTLAWFEDFLRDTTRVPFVALDHAGDLGAGVYNAETLELLAEYMRLCGSRRAGQKGERISADHVQATVSTVRLLRSAEAHYGVLVPEADTSLSNLYKAMRKEQGPRGERRACRAFRAADFRRLVATGYEHAHGEARTEWALALVAHNLLLRGGEVGRTDSAAWDPSRDLTLVSVELRGACADSRGRPWLIVWVVSIKDPQMRFRAVPLPILARADAGDPLCAYGALAAHVQRRWADVPRCAGPCAWCKRARGAARPGGAAPSSCQRANTPLFAHADGEPYCTSDVRDLGKRMATAAGMSPDEVGGKLFRIGGATDLRDALGMERAPSALKERGRWGSDIGAIYARSLLRDQLDTSAALGDAAAPEMEAMVAGWVQPATFR